MRSIETIIEELREKVRTQPRRGVTMIDGKPHRMRRGVLVEIPAEWYGKITTKQTIRKRASKKGQGPSHKSKVMR